MSRIPIKNLACIFTCYNFTYNVNLLLSHNYFVSLLIPVYCLLALFLFYLVVYIEVIIFTKILLMIIYLFKFYLLNTYFSFKIISQVLIFLMFQSELTKQAGIVIAQPRLVFRRYMGRILYNSLFTNHHCYFFF
jgi:hypothetical protein